MKKVITYIHDMLVRATIPLTMLLFTIAFVTNYEFILVRMDMDEVRSDVHKIERSVAELQRENEVLSARVDDLYKKNKELSSTLHKKVTGFYHMFIENKMIELKFLAQVQEALKKLGQPVEIIK